MEPIEPNSSDQYPTRAARGLLDTQLIATALDRAGIGIATVDAHGVVVEASAALARMLGLSRALVCGAPLLKSCHPEDRDAAERALGQGTAPGARATLRMVRGDGSHLWVDMTVAREAGEPEAIVTLDDVTAHKLAEERRHAAEQHNARLYREARDANRMKDDFLATVSHELRTPLNSIFGWTRLLRDSRLEEADVVRALDTIERNVQAQVQIIDDLLDVSRIVSGKLQLESHPIDVVSVINAAVEALRPAAESRQVHLDFAGAAPPGAVLGDANRLQQVVWNLVSNAIKFTEAGGHVSVQLFYAPPAVRVVVTDTGAGIDADFLPHVFERFRQADISTTRRHTGLGLGLAIVRHLVELHGGTVRAESEGEGRGASFVVELPSAPVDAVDSDAHVESEVAPDGPAPAPLAGLRLLVVDDEEDTRDMLVMTLVGAGAEVAAASSVDEALDIFGHMLPHVVLSDIAMPDKDGFKLVEVVRFMGARMPVIAVTAYAAARDRQRTRDAGFDAHLAKPIDPAELVETVARLARGAPNRPAL
jgi:PAS domain S-box-containing protein